MATQYGSISGSSTSKHLTQDENDWVTNRHTALTKQGTIAKNLYDILSDSTTGGVIDLYGRSYSFSGFDDGPYLVTATSSENLTIRGRGMGSTSIVRHEGPQDALLEIVGTIGVITFSNLTISSSDIVIKITNSGGDSIGGIVFDNVELAGMTAGVIDGLVLSRNIGFVIFKDCLIRNSTLGAFVSSNCTLMMTGCTIIETAQGSFIPGKSLSEFNVDTAIIQNNVFEYKSLTTDFNSLVLFANRSVVNDNVFIHNTDGANDYYPIYGDIDVCCANRIRRDDPVTNDSRPAIYLRTGKSVVADNLITEHQYIVKLSALSNDNYIGFNHAPNGSNLVHDLGSGNVVKTIF